MATIQLSGSSDLSFDPTSAAFAADPYSVYEQLRREESLPYFEDIGAHLVSRFADVTRLAQDKKMVRAMSGIFSSEEIEKQKRINNFHDMPDHERFVQFSLLDSEGEIHSRLRKQVFKVFSPAAIQRLRGTVQTFFDDLIDALDSTEVDFIEDLAAIVPGHVIGHLIGVPLEDRPKLRVWSEDIVQYWDVNRTPEKKKLAEDTTTEFYEYLCDLLRERRKQPQDDLLSLLIEAQAAGSLNEDELISTCMLILKAGHGSTLDVLGTGMYSLLRFPEQMARLRSDPSLIDSAVQEMFRFESPLPFFHRFATEDTEIGASRYAKATKFILLYGAANRDATQFERADEFDIGRKPNRHLAFGGGAHFCLGNHLARLNMDIMFTTLLRRFSQIELAQNNPEFKRGLAIRGLKRLQVSLRP